MSREINKFPIIMTIVKICAIKINKIRIVYVIKIFKFSYSYK